MGFEIGVADRRRSALATPPVFFASRLVAQGREARIVEYCVVDILGAVKLMVTVTWTADASRPGAWIPTRAARAAVLLICQLFRGQRVVVARLLDDEAMQPLWTNGADLDVVELRDILERRASSPDAPGLDGRIERLRADLSRPDGAHGDALLLKGCWRLVDAHLRGSPPVVTGFRPGPSEQPVRPVGPAHGGVLALAWWLGAALLIQICVTGALWLLPIG